MDRISGENYFTQSGQRRFTDGPPATTIPAEWLNSIQEEIMAVIEGASYAADSTKLNQLKIAIAAMVHSLSSYAISGGAGGNYSVTLTGEVPNYTEGLLVFFKANHANTGAVTLAVNGLTAIDVKKFDNQALVAGDIEQNAVVFCVYDSVSGVFRMVNAKTRPMQSTVGWTSFAGAASFVATSVTFTVPSGVNLLKIRLQGGGGGGCGSTSGGGYGGSTWVALSSGSVIAYASGGYGPPSQTYYSNWAISLSGAVNSPAQVLAIKPGGRGLNCIAGGVATSFSGGGDSMLGVGGRNYGNAVSSPSGYGGGGAGYYYMGGDAGGYVECYYKCSPGEVLTIVAGGGGNQLAAGAGTGGTPGIVVIEY